MGLNISKGNMYEWVTHTWNAIKGACPHDCSYCYMKKWKNQKPVRLDEAEFKEFDKDMVKYGEGQFIFVGSSCDMFAKNIPYEWIIKVIQHLIKYDNTYLFQSKNPKGFDVLAIENVERFILCTTIETNRVYPEIMRNSPDPVDRAIQFGRIPIEKKYVTIEPVMDFDINSLVSMIEICKPIQVNIGADSGGNKLPEPDKNKVNELIEALDVFTKVKLKKNINRIMK